MRLAAACRGRERNRPSQGFVDVALLKKLHQTRDVLGVLLREIASECALPGAKAQRIEPRGKLAHEP